MKRETLIEHNQPLTNLPPQRKCYDEIIDFLARGASPAEIVAFRPSEETQDRVRYLLERNSEGELTEDEAGELAVLGELEHVMQLVKLRAREYFKTKT